MQIKTENNLLEPLRRDFVSASQRTGLHISEDTEFYIANTLRRFGLSEEFFRIYDRNMPFTFMYKRAKEADNSYERFLGSKNLGDAIMYVGGFFPESMEGSFDFYIGMGREGYFEAAGIAKKGKPIYREMAEKLPKIVDTLNEIKESTETVSNMHIMDIYNRWLKTRSPRLKTILKKKNVIPLKDP